MTATATAPSIEDLKASMRTRTTAQLIGLHDMADTLSTAPGNDDSDGTAWTLVLLAIEAVLTERGVAICDDCGTPSKQHADFCRIANHVEA